MLRNNIFKNLFPKRDPNTNKGDYGKVLILAGSPGMLGAAILSSRAALRVGPGLVYLALPEKLKIPVNLATPEVITISIKDLMAYAIKADAIAIGPGLGENKTAARKLLQNLSRIRYSRPVILDADGINAFAGKIKELSRLRLELVLTPHPGEMGRLLKRTAGEIQKERKMFALETAQALRGLVVLKGYRTVVADPSGKIYINKTGNPAMATAGMGDVLTGMIAGLAAQGFPIWDAVAAGVYLHGLAGDLAAAERGEYGLTASDVIEKIPYAIQKNS